mmetsp:Transcript_24796/g.38950  ORF Transcript_24796/g.38950 Transcript_24796/m.38950 type:complete len:407 (-) Transcript_24796:1699-2919(-)
MGPGALVAVGYMDPGNWATDLAGGSMYNYQLLFVILLSSGSAMFLQYLSLRLGIVTRLDLAQACREKFSKEFSVFMWIGAELAIAACDLAEVIGSAVALKLLFGIPLVWGVMLTALDVLVVLATGGKDMRVMEILIVALMFVIFTCFAVELYFSKPSFSGILKGAFIPSSELVTDPNMLYVSIGILGATVMPHNLYLHSSLVQTRNIPKNSQAVKQSIRMCLFDSNLSLSLAFFVNAAILILAASTFYRTGHKEVADIEVAYLMLDRVLGQKLASVLFAVALLASGQQSTLTGTLAGQIVMEGFVKWKINPVYRRLMTRLSAIIPAVIVVSLAGNKGVNEMLVLSQVVLSVQLSFAVIPLVMFTSDESMMGEFVNSKATKITAWIVAATILGLNVLLVVQIATGQT